jgi:hypothetical protein
MFPGGGEDISSEDWAAQLLERDGYMVVITKPELGGSATSYHTAAKSGIDFLLSAANPYLAEADTQRVGACGWSLGARALARTQEEDLRVDCIVAWDNLAISENGDEGSPSGGGSGTPQRTPRVPALGQASEMPGVDAQSKIFAWEQWRARRIPCAEVVFAVGTTTAAHLKWGTTGSVAEHDRFHHYTRCWFDRWLKNDRMGVERLLVSTLDGTAASSYLSTAYVGALYADGYDSADLRSLIVNAATARPSPRAPPILPSPPSTTRTTPIATPPPRPATVFFSSCRARVRSPSSTGRCCAAPRTMDFTRWASCIQTRPPWAISPAPSRPMPRARCAWKSSTAPTAQRSSA